MVQNKTKQNRNQKKKKKKNHLKYVDKPGRFSAILTKETTFMTSCLLLHNKKGKRKVQGVPTPSEKGSILQGKNLLPTEEQILSV